MDQRIRPIAIAVGRMGKPRRLAAGATIAASPSHDPGQSLVIACPGQRSSIGLDGSAVIFRSAQ